jgi:hypothetical protein
MENNRTLLQYCNKPRNCNQKGQHEKGKVKLIGVRIIQQCIHDSG